MLTEILLAEQCLKSFFGPTSRCRRQVADYVSRCAFLGGVFQDLLVINWPTEFLGDPPANRTAACACLAADGDCQGSGHGRGVGRWAAVALEPVQRRLHDRRMNGLARWCSDPFGFVHDTGSVVVVELICFS